MNHVPEAPQSASGDYAWLGAEPGSVADQLYMSAADEWNQAINSRFVNELLDDTLPESILKSYLIQDFKFFNQGIMAHENLGRTHYCAVLHGMDLSCLGQAHHRRWRRSADSGAQGLG